MAQNGTGTVTESTGSHYIIQTDEGVRLETKLRGRLRLNNVRTTNPVANRAVTILSGGHRTFPRRLI